MLWLIRRKRLRREDQSTDYLSPCIYMQQMSGGAATAGSSSGGEPFKLPPVVGNPPMVQPDIRLLVVEDSEFMQLTMKVMLQSIAEVRSLQPQLLLFLAHNLMHLGGPLLLKYASSARAGHRGRWHRRSAGQPFHTKP